MLQNLINRIRGIRAAASLTYSELVRDTAAHADCRLSDDELERTLAAAGKTLESFEQDVGRIASRRQAAMDIKHAVSLLAEADQARGAAVEAREVYQETKRRCEAEIKAAETEYRGASSEADRMAATARQLRIEAEQILQRTADPSIDRDIAQIDRQIAELQAESTKPWAPPPEPQPAVYPRAGLLDVPDESGVWGRTVARSPLEESAAPPVSTAAQAVAERRKHQAALQDRIGELTARRQSLEKSKLTP